MWKLPALVCCLISISFLLLGCRSSSEQYPLPSAIPIPTQTATAVILRRYEPVVTRTPDPNTNVVLDSIQLVSSQEVTSANTTAEELADFIQKIEGVLQEVAKGNKAESRLRIQVALYPKESHKIEIATQGNADEAWLQRLYKELQSMPTLHTKTTPVTFQVYFTVKPDK